MTDYLSKFKMGKNPNQQYETSELILNELSNQIYSELKEKNINTYVSTSQGYGDGKMMITLNLMSGNNRNQYFYRLIEIEQPIDKVYEVKIRAFQNPPTEWKNISSAKELKEELVEIMGDSRIQIIFEMVSQMGKTIENWDKDEE
jgi:hypothetical protein